jgi:putative inorganic carbon (HCO3(-)) transporter
VPLRGLLLAAFMFPSLPVCLMRPFYGIVLWTIIAFTSIQWYSYSAYDVPWALIVAIPTISGAVLFGKNWRGVLSIHGVLLILLWCWFTMTTLLCDDSPLLSEHASWAWIRWQYVSKVILMTLVSIAVIDSFERVRNLVLVIATCFGVFVVKCLPFLVLQGGENRVYGPEKSMIADNNDFGLALNMTLPLFFFLAQSETRPWLKRLFWGLTFATVPAIFFTYSRGALIGLVAVIGLMFLQLKRRWLLVPVFVLGVLVALLLAPDKWKERMDPTRENAIDGSAYSRINAWTFAWRLSMDFPITGGGFETFSRELFARYATNTRDVHGPHSIYFGVLGEHGFVGLFLYLTTLTSCFGSARRVLRWARLRGDEVAAHYANMFCISMVGFLVSGCFLGRQYFDYLFTLLAFMIVLKHVCLQRWAEQDNQADLIQEEVAA